MSTAKPGALMRQESNQAADTLLAGITAATGLDHLAAPASIYTVARGSSDAAATVLNYEFMRELAVPATTLPPSIFSLGAGVDMTGMTVVTISQSGASDDLVAATKGATARGAQTIAITNVDASAVESAATARAAINAGPERAVPATKTVVGAIAVGANVIGDWVPAYRAKLQAFANSTTAEELNSNADWLAALPAKITAAEHVFVVGREGLFGAAQEIALKIKECCGIHAEAYSASEVLHGPMQIAENGLLTILLDDGSPQTQAGLDLAEDRLSAGGSDVHRLVLDIPAPQAICAAVFLIKIYPVILEAALSLDRDPDAPPSLAKVTVTV